MDDFALVRPTIVASTPRFWTLLYNQYLHTLYEAYTAHLAETAHKGAGKSQVSENFSEDGSDASESEEAKERQLGIGEKQEESAVTEETQRVTTTTDAGNLESDVTMVTPSPPADDPTSTPKVADNAIHRTAVDEDVSADHVCEGGVRNDISNETASDSVLEIAPVDIAEEGEQLQSLSNSSTLPPTPSNFDPSSVPLPIRQKVLKQFRFVLGGREQIISTGGAPTGKAVKMFMIHCFKGILQEGYGTTEVRITHLNIP